MRLMPDICSVEEGDRLRAAGGGAVGGCRGRAGRCLAGRDVRLAGGQELAPREPEDAERFFGRPPASKSERYVFV